MVDATLPASAAGTWELPLDAGIPYALQILGLSGSASTQDSLVVLNHGSAQIYLRVDGQATTVGDPGAFVLRADAHLRIALPAAMSQAGVGVISLISPSSGAFSVLRPTGAGSASLAVVDNGDGTATLS